MTTWRATYRPGSGFLFVSGERLLFIDDADHPDCSTLLAAAESGRPLQSLASEATDAASALPSFVFLQQRGELEGMASGSIQVAIADGETSAISDPRGSAMAPDLRIAFRRRVVGRRGRRFAVDR